MSLKKDTGAVKIFRALSVEKRVEIVELLAERTLCVGALSNLLDISAGASQILGFRLGRWCVGPEPSRR